MHGRIALEARLHVRDFADIGVSTADPTNGPVDIALTPCPFDRN